LIADLSSQLCSFDSLNCRCVSSDEKAKSFQAKMFKPRLGLGMPFVGAESALSGVAGQGSLFPSGDLRVALAF
jgi:hypothetical protein